VNNVPDIFSIVGSRDQYRVYKWGTVDVRNLDHCDLVLLEALLFEGANLTKMKKEAFDKYVEANTSTPIQQPKPGSKVGPTCFIFIAIVIVILAIILSPK